MIGGLIDAEVEALHHSLRKSLATGKYSNNQNNIGNTLLTEEDRDNLHAHSLRIKSHMPRATFNELREKFSHKMDIDSEYKMLKCFEGLTAITPMKIDCCINSCIAYTARYSHSDLCDFCGERRFDAQEKPRRQFSYMPLVPQLQGLFAQEDTVEKLSYRHQYDHSPGTVNDVFDGEIYRSLQDKFVLVDGIQKNYKYFSGRNDIAFSLATDGYLLFGRYRK
ncbi:hypothetical protein EDD22DRAFT_788864, partial [Suillus occidentalis]